MTANSENNSSTESNDQNNENGEVIETNNVDDNIKNSNEKNITINDLNNEYNKSFNFKLNELEHNVNDSDLIKDIEDLDNNPNIGSYVEEIKKSTRITKIEPLDNESKEKLIEENKLDKIYKN